MPRPHQKPLHDDSMLSYALVGMEAAKEKIEQKIAEIKVQLAGATKGIKKAVEVFTEGAPVKKRRALSAAARKRIAAAQRKRWAAVRETKETPAKKAKGKPRPKPV